MELHDWTESPGFINSINSNCFHGEPPWSLSSFQQPCQLWTSHLNHHGPLTLLLAISGCAKLAFPQRLLSSWGRALSEESEPEPSLPLLLLLRIPKNLKERQHPMLFSWDGSGTETTCYFRTSELAPSPGKKKMSQFTLWFSLPSSPCSFNFHSRK